MLLGCTNRHGDSTSLDEFVLEFYYLTTVVQSFGSVFNNIVPELKYFDTITDRALSRIKCKTTTQLLFQEELRDNLTVSVMSFVPTLDDDGKPITCRAENPNVTSLYLETSWTISVVYPPVVKLRLGSSLAAGDIKEGDDVYFECHVRANPPARKLSWLHDDRQLAHNATARVFHSNQSLVLQKVTRHSSGRYACSALNAEGETVSNELHFRVKYAPSCRSGGVSVVGAARGESVVIVCEVDADPPAAVFKWKFNNSGETLDVAADRYTSNGSASSLKYTPVADLDYGTLSCAASNEVGTQLAPCVFQMVAAGTD
ncbi:jg5041 [Pararge aegeria aegeria]|uniref:Jg5041 protein n=1 Tax=Pararge aegeria aegeria TaxID=348720 RepID=A0A8S4SK88_9NEOP|nr:jg5041 [Pararge aegeria aegeria]